METTGVAATAAAGMMVETLVETMAVIVESGHLIVVVVRTIHAMTGVKTLPHDTPRTTSAEQAEGEARRRLPLAAKRTLRVRLQCHQQSISPASRDPWRSRRAKALRSLANR